MHARAHEQRGGSRVYYEFRDMAAVGLISQESIYSGPGTMTWKVITGSWGTEYGSFSEHKINLYSNVF